MSAHQRSEKRVYVLGNGHDQRLKIRREIISELTGKIHTSQANDSLFISPPEIPRNLPGIPMYVSADFVRPSLERKGISVLPKTSRHKSVRCKIFSSGMGDLDKVKKWRNALKSKNTQKKNMFTTVICKVQLRFTLPFSSKTNTLNSNSIWDPRATGLSVARLFRHTLA